MLTLLIDEDKPLKGLLASATAGGIGYVPDISVADSGQATSVQTFKRIAGVITDSFVTGDVLHIGIGDGINAPVCYIALTSASPATGTMPINTDGMVALFALVPATQQRLQLQVGVVRTRAVETNTIFSAPIVIHRSVIDPETAVPTPSILGAGVYAALLEAVNGANGIAVFDSLGRYPARDGSQITNLPSGGVSTFAALTDKTTADIPAINAPLATALNAKQGTITFGTGVQSALGVAIGSAGAPVLQSGPTSGNAASATLAATVTVANEGADTTCFLLFTNSATGSLAIKSNVNATYDALNSRIEVTGDASALVVNGSNATLQAKNGVSGGISINPSTISCTLPSLGVTGIRFADSSGFHNLYVPATDGNFVTTGDTATVSNAMIANAAVANLTGTNTGDQTSVSGNAGTATVLANTRTIGGSNFNGSANVTSFPAPGPIGGGTPDTIAFTSATGQSSLTLGVREDTNGTLVFLNTAGIWATTVQSNAAVSGNVTHTLPNTTGTLVGSGDTGTVTNTMLAGSIAPSKVTGTAATLGANTFMGTQTFTAAITNGTSATAFLLSDSTLGGTVRVGMTNSGNTPYCGMFMNSVIGFTGNAVFADTSTNFYTVPSGGSHHFRVNNVDKVVFDSSGNTTIAGTLGVTSATTLGGGTAIKNIRFGISSAMVIGAVTITDTGATANTRYFFSCAALGTVAIAGTYSPTARSNGASVTCTSSQATETSTIYWLAFEP